MSFYLIFISIVFLPVMPIISLEDNLIGRWKMESVFEGIKDVTEAHNPANNRWIEFKDDKTFVSDGDPYGRNTGTWHIDEETSILHIDSDIEDDDSEWDIQFEQEKVIWTGRGNAWKENFKLIHRREEPR